MSNLPKDSWLVRPSSIRILWIVFSIVLALTVLAQFFIKIKGYFGVDDWFAFGAVYGFGSCLLMVVFAKLLGFVLKRDEDYYSEEDET
jgi:sterol desaturase/sphingolipid hydroxylase (fatty acid hydroxylase superfamily)